MRDCGSGVLLPTATQHACKLGCEGIVSKRLGSLYRFGRSPLWLNESAGSEAGSRRGLGALKQNGRTDGSDRTPLPQSRIGLIRFMHGQGSLEGTTSCSPPDSICVPLSMLLAERTSKPPPLIVVPMALPSERTARVPPTRRLYWKQYHSPRPRQYRR